ncbi:MAG TPA: DUF1385 domain-containing protein [Clostridia bacterium]|nr:DUF1385 domain-containing protein [Clostridia bacterium]
MKQVQKPARVCAIGGQAVMEGVMMKAPSGIAMAVRRADGTIATEYTPYESKSKKGTFLGLPIVRGVVTFVEVLSLGMRTITRSAELYGEEEVQSPSKFEEWLSKKTGKPVEKIAIGLAVVLALALSIGLFFMLPTFVSGLLLHKSSSSSFIKSVVEGLVRLLIFILYLAGISALKDVRRIFMYHGAEHKVIACYEHEAPLTAESCRTFTRLHARCGTNYMFLVMAVSILFFAAVGFSSNFYMRLLTRLVFLPVVAGISYEVLRFAGKSDNLLARIVRAPGVALQRLTTREPDDKMLEVALAAFALATNPPAEVQETASVPAS